MGVKGRRVGAARVAQALAQSRGLITVAARIAGCSPDTIRAYMRRFEVCRVAFTDAQDAMGDIAEGALYRAITNSDPWAVQFYLKTKQRHRGYGDRAEVDVNATVSGGIRLDIEGFIRAVNEAVNDGASEDAASGGATIPTEDVVSVGG